MASPLTAADAAVCHECRPTIEQLRQHPWVNQDYHVAQPREPVPKAGTGSDLFEPTVNPENLSLVSGRPRPVSAVALIWLILMILMECEYDHK